jgi:hypothetical protein
VNKEEVIMATRTTTLVGAVLALGAFTSAPAAAGSLDTQTADFAFDGTKEIAAKENVAKLSESEMKATKGEYLGRAAGGFVGGVASFGASVYGGHGAVQTGLNTAYGAYNGAVGNYGAVAKSVGTTLGSSSVSSGYSSQSTLGSVGGVRGATSRHGFGGGHGSIGSVGGGGGYGGGPTSPGGMGVAGAVGGI